jgi:very-short-patch-repair endonuclease
VTLPRHRKRRPTAGILHWSDLQPHERLDGVTAPLRTVLDCARTLPFDQALAIADSALRLGLVGPIELARAVERLGGPGRGRVRAVGLAADGRAGSGLESVLRAILITQRIRGFLPQVAVRDEGLYARVDLADELRMIALEADSFEFHGSRDALVRDCRRYDELAVRGWLVLRFAWEHVMFDQEWVAATVRAAQQRRRPAHRPTGTTRTLARLGA